MSFLIELLSDHTLQIVSFGALILGITAGSLGVFAVLRQQSLMGDAIAHATLPGIGIVFLLTQTKNPIFLLIGAGLSGWLGALFVILITHHTRIKKDTALGIVLSFFFGIGLVLLTIIQRLPTATKAGLDKFLFGNAATLLKDDITIMISLSLIILITLMLFWKEFKLVVFDQDYAKSLGLNVQGLDVLLTTLIVAAIVIGLQTVGVVLMSAMLVAPAAAARQWTDRLSIMVLLAASFGAFSGVAGAITSSLKAHLPTGPIIVVYVSAFVFISLFFAPNRGIAWDWIRMYRHRKHIQMSAMLKNLLLFSEIQTDPFHPHDIAALTAIGRGAIHKTMMQLSKKGLAKQYPDKRWALTPQGLEEARQSKEKFESDLNVHPSN
ncbi:Manganese ABC transporter, inner membrane permease protein SitC [hydrothermal vent metagenome]|uniref:Manganese ABC transporter, inner membrane permease protein SitC n=1 Tax=hydrothermal vent metagenome TaxID=652676 RepID=A0A3B1DLY2_9ZZZZ